LRRGARGSHEKEGPTRISAAFTAAGAVPAPSEKTNRFGGEAFGSDPVIHDLPRRQSMSEELKGKRIAILVANEGVEQVELTEPVDALREAGAEIDLLAPEAGEVQAFDHLDKSETFPVDRVVGDADASEYDGLVLPGGVANPDQLRTHEEAVEFVRAFFEAGKPVGAICHAPWTLVEAGVLEGRTITSWPSLETDIRNAGAEWVDEEVHVDQGLVTSRKPDDLPAFNAKIVEEFGEGVHDGQRRGAAVETSA
jgi:protease I